MDLIYFSGSQLRGRHEVHPSSPFNPPNPSHIQGAYSSASHCMRSKLYQILKFTSEHIILLNLVANVYES
ncbi:hypothetical protein [Campylobacter concisus]